MLTNTIRLSVAMLSVAASSSYAINPSPTDVAAMNAMKFKVDVLGVKLGMPTEQARSVMQSLTPKVKFFEYVDKRTNQSIGWSATSESCAIPHAAMCEETIDVRHSAGKVWFVGRLKRYNRKKSSDVPTIQVTKQSLAEKYGPLVKLADYSRGLYASYTFNRDGGSAELHGMTAGCGGDTDGGGVPLFFSPKIGWFYNVIAVAEDPTFLGSLRITLSDCEHNFDVLNGKAMSDAAAEKEVRDRDVAKGIKPKL